MRHVVIVAVLVLLVPAAVLAQVPEKPTAFYVFVTNPGYTSSGSYGSGYEGAVGVALQRMFTPRISGELSVSQASHLGGFTTFNPDGSVLESHIFTVHTTPIDLTTTYHFFTQGSWKPYAGVGVRYVDNHTSVDNRTSLDLTGGVVWQFHRNLGLRFDGKVLVGGNTRFNDQVNGSVGLSWRF